MKYLTKILLLFSLSTFGQYNNFSYKEMKNGKYAIFNKFFKKQITEPIYDNVYIQDSLCMVGRDKKYGFVDYTGNEVIPVIYDKVNHFSEGLVSVLKSGKYGFINKKGEVKIDFKFEDADYFSDGYCSVIISKNNKKKRALIDKKGTIIFEKEMGDNLYSSNYHFKNGFTFVRNDNLQYACMNLNGELITPYKYCEVENFKKGIAIVSDSCQFSGMCLSINDSRYGFIDENGKEIIPIAFKNPKYIKNTSFVSVDKGWTSSLYDTKGNVIVPLGKYSKFENFDTISKLIKVEVYFEKDSSKEGVINFLGKEIIKPSKHNNIRIQKGLIIITKNFRKKKTKFFDLKTIYENDYKTGVFDSLGNAIIPFGRYGIKKILKNHNMIATKNSKLGFINQKGKELTPFKYHRITDFNKKGFATGIDVNRQVNCIDRNGNVLSIPNYDETDIFIKDELLLVKHNNKYGFINVYNKLKIDFIYDEAERFNDGLARVRLAGKYGYINPYGKVVIPIMFDEAFYYFHNDIPLTLNGFKYYYDRQGNLLEKNK